MQLKAFIKKKAAEKHISAQLVMQNYMLERLLARIALSEFNRNFILKGGFLISAIVGLDTRATMDLDTTIKGFTLTHETLRGIFAEICAVEIDDDLRPISLLCNSNLLIYFKYHDRIYIKPKQERVTNNCNSISDDIVSVASKITESLEGMKVLRATKNITGQWNIKYVTISDTYPIKRIEIKKLKQSKIIDYKGKKSKCWIKKLFPKLLIIMLDFIKKNTK